VASIIQRHKPTKGEEQEDNASALDENGDPLPK
jgi:hypothetical protein